MKRIEKSGALRFDAEGYQIDMKDLNREALPDPEKLEFRPFFTVGQDRAWVARRTDASRFSCS